MNTHRSQQGLTLVEVLVAIVLLAVLLVPAVNALMTGVTGSQVHGELAQDHYRLTARLEELLAEPYADLLTAAEAAGASTVASSYSDPAGPGRLLVYLSAYDGDNADADDNPFTGTDAGLIWIRVAAEGTVHELHTIRAIGN